jgi:hypothetical protein
MALVRYERSIASISWIDVATGLPEVDRTPPGGQVSRAFVMGNAGYRFANYMEVWATYDTSIGTIVGHGFGSGSGLYRAPSYGGIPSAIGETTRSVRVGREPITFIQMLGARTQSPEKIGGIFGPLGNIFASAVVHFPPIWTELQLMIYNDGRFEGRVLRHSIFPSMTFYVLGNDPTSAPSALLYRTPVPTGGQFYNAVPNLDRWKREGWGDIRGTNPGPTPGNPWGMAESVLTGIDPSQPFGW